jgi:hypothetical protein
MTTPTSQTPPALPLTTDQAPAAAAPPATTSRARRGAASSAAPRRNRSQVPEPPAAQPAPPPVVHDDYELPKEWQGLPEAPLLLEACNVFGIDPDQTLPIFNPARHRPTASTRFRELLAQKFNPGDRNAGVEPSITLVTAGGVKIGYFADGTVDPDTETRLRQIFKAYHRDKKTGEVTPRPLPDDLTLPATAVLGFAPEDANSSRRLIGK